MERGRTLAQTVGTSCYERSFPIAFHLLSAWEISHHMRKPYDQSHRRGYSIDSSVEQFTSKIAFSTSRDLSRKERQRTDALSLEPMDVVDNDEM